MQLDQLITQIREQYVLDKSAAIGADTELLMSGLLDSLAAMNLVAWIESETAMAIEPTELVIENFETPSAIIGLIDRLTGT